MAKILLVEDEEETRVVVTAMLDGANFLVDAVASGSEALTWLKTYQYDLLIFDWNLPGVSGIDLIKEVRNLKNQTPILMLTGNAEIGHKESGFNSGADDYLTKPFHPKELLLRVNALLKRSGDIKTKPVTVRGLTVDAQSCVVVRDEQIIQLTAREFQLLDFLLRRPDQFFDSTTLLNRVWESDSDATDEALRTCVKRLRQKLDLPGLPSLITSVRGLGYKIDSLGRSGQPDP